MTSEVPGLDTPALGALAVGTVVGGRYRIVSVLGRGGFGITYEATYGELGARAAVKELFLPGSVRFGSTVQPPESQRSRFAMIRDRFVEEGRTLARYDHPGIVKVFDVVRDFNTTYLVMELLVGETLETVLSRGPLPESQVRNIFEKVAEALDVLHADDTLHRDIKPANIVSNPTRGPVLIDFGSSRQLVATGDDSYATAMVTSGYAPVEQYQSRGSFGPPTDLYSLAATALHALTGTAPPSSLDRLDVSDGGETDDPLVVPDTTDPRFADAIRRCLNTKPEARPQSVRELTKILSAVPSTRIDERPAPAPLLPPLGRVPLVVSEVNKPGERASRSIRVPALVALAATIAIILVVGGAFRLLAGSSDAKPLRVSYPGAVMQVAWSPDGERFVTAGQDGTAKMWKADGAAIATLAGHTDSLSSVAWSPDGLFLVTGSWDRTIRIWDADTAKTTRTLSGHTDSVSAVAWSPDGTQLATASWDRTIRLWNLTSGAEEKVLSGHSDRVLSIAWSPDGTRLASGGADDVVKLWARDSTRPIGELVGHDANVVTIAWAPDGKTLASAGDDKQIKLWDEPKGSLRGTIDEFREFVVGLAWSSQGDRIAAASWDGNVSIFDAQGELLNTLSAHTNRVLGVAFSPQGTLASVGADSAILLWEPNATIPKTTLLSGHSTYVQSVAWSRDSSQLVTAGSDASVRIWDARSGDNVTTLTGHRGFVSAVAWSSDGAVVASGGEDRTVKLWNTTDGTETASLVGHSQRVVGVAFSADGTQLASASFDGTVKVWETGSGQLLVTLDGGSRPLTSVTWSPDGQQLAAGSADGLVRIFSPNAPSAVRVLKNPSSDSLVSTVAWSPDGSTLAVSGSDAAIQLWDTATWTIGKPFGGHTNSVLAVTWSPDSKELVTAGLDNTTRVWDVPSGSMTAMYTDHLSGMRAAAFSPDGKALVSSDSVLVIRSDP